MGCAISAVEKKRGDNDSCARKWCWFEDFRHFALIWCKNTVDLLMRLMAFHGFSEASFRRYIRGASRWKLWIGQLSPNYTCLSKIWQCWSFASLFSSKKQLNRADLRWILRQKEQGEPNIFGWKKMWSKDGVCVYVSVCVCVCVWRWGCVWVYLIAWCRNVRLFRTWDIKRCLEWGGFEASGNPESWQPQVLEENRFCMVLLCVARFSQERCTM